MHAPHAPHAPTAAPDPAAAAAAAAAASVSSAAHPAQQQCAICLEDIVTENKHDMDCGHAFHATCLIPWLMRGNTSCPMCRRRTEVAHGMNTLTLQARASYIRRTVARRRDPPAELVRILGVVRRAERAQREAVQRANAYARSNREVIATLRRLRRARWAARRKVLEAKCILGSFECDGLRLPGLADSSSISSIF